MVSSSTVSPLTITTPSVLDFETAAILRDEIKALKAKLDQKKK
jgi:protein-arginine kinase activator protein McsA